jgi:dipeptidyl aminopeptidase/acylaminoacyl peptidase
LQAARGSAAADAATGREIEYSNVAYTPDGKGLILTSDEADEFRQLVHYDLATGATTVMSAGIPWDITSVAMARKSGVVAVVANEAGRGVLRLFDSASRKELPRPVIPEGMVSGIGWHDNGVDLGFNLQGARNPGDAYSLDVKTGAVTRWTETKVDGLDTAKLREPDSISWKSFDGLTITGFLFRRRRSTAAAGR